MSKPTRAQLLAEIRGLTAAIKPGSVSNAPAVERWADGSVKDPVAELEARLDIPRIEAYLNGERRDPLTRKYWQEHEEDYGLYLDAQRWREGEEKKIAAQKRFDEGIAKGYAEIEANQAAIEAEKYALDDELHRRVDKYWESGGYDSPPTYPNPTEMKKQTSK